MNINLRVNGFRQEHKLGCGAAALRSILDFFGTRISEKEIITSAGGIYADEEYQGVLSIHMAKMVHKLGYRIHAYTYNMELLKPGCALLNQEEHIETLEKLQKKLEKTKSRIKMEIIASMIYLFKNRQDIKIKFPDKEDIVGFLRKGVPVLISVRSRIFYRDACINEKAGHYLVVKGYEKNKFFVIDPFDGKEHSIDESLLILAWRNNALDSTDYLLAIEAENNIIKGSHNFFV